MIRLPPSFITLSATDIKNYEKRQKRQKPAEVAENTYQEFARFEMGALDGPSFGQPQNNIDYFHNLDGQYGILARQVANCHISSAEDAGQEDHFWKSPIAPRIVEVISSRGPVFSPENLINEIQQPSSPSEDAFQYGGFVESPGYFGFLVRSSPFLPDDASTPQPQQTNIPALRPRMIPRSPLFHSQNASSSPEHILTSSLTPRVASRVASHHTPGIIFSQPARRRTRFRHQTNSFSFDESERSSAVYEQERVSSNSTTELHPVDELSLHEELRGSSLQSSTIISTVSSSPPPPEEHESISLDRNEFSRRDLIFSLPALPIPPPFSAITQNLPRPESIPSVEHGISNPATSLVGSASSSPIHHVSAPVLLTQPTSHATDELGDGVPSSPPLNRSSSRRQMLSSAIRLLSPYRDRSPLGGSTSPPFRLHLPSPSTSPTPRQSKFERTAKELEPQTPSRQYQVYDDSRSPASQPQTPSQLPEARHQSRFHPSYTAPVSRVGWRAGLDAIHYSDGTTIDVSRVRNISATPTRRHIGRSGSPIGMLGSDGFRGLYGGRENGDEEQNWSDGVSSTSRVWSGHREHYERSFRNS